MNQWDNNKTTNLKMHTPDFADKNFQKLMALFPNAVTETINDVGEVVRAIDADVLRQEISAEVVEGPQERYQFTWPDKKKSVVLANAPIAKTLRLDRSKSVGRDGTRGKIDSENIYIEGDNLDTLKLLQETYLGKVKIIYIDPPYNTGNDFIYEDDFSQETREYLTDSGQYDDEGNRLVQNTESNGRFHTNWLNMLYPRLRIAKDFLAKDGVILISIDDNEVENLKKICDEIFGASNFTAQLVWEKKKKGSFLSNTITNIKEYILVYCKLKETFDGLIGEINSEEETYPCINASNKRELRIIPAGIESKYKEKDYFLPKGTEISDTTMSIVLHSDLVIRNGFLAEELVVEGNWRYSQSAMKTYSEKKELYITRDLYLRRIVNDTRYKALKDLLPRVGDNANNTYSSPINTNCLFDSGWGSNEDADEELRSIFGVQKIMDYPKPVRLIEKLLASYRSCSDYLILDFFSGSATTAHAVMQLNAEDGGNRKFIMVQLPEVTDVKSEARKAGYKTICDIGEERIRRAGDKIRHETGADIDYGFRVFRVDSTNMQDVYYTPAEYDQAQMDMLADNIKSDRTPEDLLFQVVLDLGVPLSSSIAEEAIDGKKVFVVAEPGVSQIYLMACFDKDVTEKTVTEIAKRHPFYAVFRDSSMASDSVATNFEQLFSTYSPETIRKVL